MDSGLHGVLADLLRESDGLARRSHVNESALRLLHQYYRHVASADIETRSPADLLGAVLSHLRLGRQRPVGTAAVRIITPQEAEHGWSVGRCVVEIVTDDMPFLVDSVSAALTGSGHAIDLVIHPIVRVRRDIAGGLVEVLAEDEPRMDGADGGVCAESWIHVEIDRAGPDPEALAARLRHVLRDVREAVEDWTRMRSTALGIARELREAPPLGIDPQMVAETSALLDWLVDDNFTFLGFREYVLRGDIGEESLTAVAGTGLGILRADQPADRAFSRLPPEVQALAREPVTLVLTKANSRSTVHRPGYLDYIGVKAFDETGAVIGERRFLGLYAASAYTQSVTQVPVIRRRVEEVFAISGVPPETHTGKAIENFLETYPREELFLTPAVELAETAMSVYQMGERRQTRLFCRRDPYGRFVSCLVYLPRDRYTTAVRLRIQSILRESFGASVIDHSARVSESVHARLYFVVRLAPGEVLGHPDIHEVEDRIRHAVRSWEDDFVDALVERFGEDAGGELTPIYRDAFPEGYKEDFTARTAAADVAAALEVDPQRGVLVHLYEPLGEDPSIRRLKVYRIGDPISLTTFLPVLNSMGVDVLDERPYQIERAGADHLWIYDFGMSLGSMEIPDPASLSDRFAASFMAVWEGYAEVDGLNALVVRAGLHWREVTLLRTYARYLRQTGTSFAPEHIEAALLGNAHIAISVVRLFHTRFDPGYLGDREGDTQVIVDRIGSDLDGVARLDEDRILRSLLAMVQATWRTNFFQGLAEGTPREIVTIKVDPQRIPALPLPRPRFEIWAYSPRVEGVHLRFGPIARGGLRWSDRSADFRTEILGLVKAQEVKNAVIVPVGAKGGFLAKKLPDPTTDRSAWLAEGRAAYASFISGLLDITDNLVDGKVVAPVDVVRHDGDDPYLVVAADKGTASFSDLANEVAASYSFWLGDAFASGGSAGYDHKAMGITARGAWESVKRHFRELGVDVQTEDFTVVGIGDMSGDVFGNGMLLSEHIRLIAAFDHRHVFIDPQPDAAISFAERRRLFGLPRSSWADYDPALISPGGGVFDRSAKSIPLTEQMRRALGIAEGVDALEPNEVIRRVLTAPVDLLWNGGIGTYVKSQSQTNAEVGDKANDVLRVDGVDLRCRVVGEGGNLGFTQWGRVEAARAGVRLNTDAIDNSAGVDTSDHEVNIKILLDAVVGSGDLTLKQRDVLLSQMTDEVAGLVLRDNYEQNVLMGNARRGAAALVSVHARMIRDLEARGVLDRAVEYLPSDEELATRMAAGQGLTSPELCVLAAYAKISLSGDLDGELYADPYFAAQLPRYFPRRLAEAYADRLGEHPLRERIVTTMTVNDVINHGGITLVFRACEETGAAAVEVVRAAVAVMAIFDLRGFWDRIDALDNRAPTEAQCALHLESRRLLDRAIRWFLQTRGGTLDVTIEVDRFQGVVMALMPQVIPALRGAERDRFEIGAARFTEMGAPVDLAEQASAMLDNFALLDIVEISQRTGQNPAVVLDIYFALSERYDVDRFLTQITMLGRSDRWTALARQALRSDLYAALAELTLGVVRTTPGDTPTAERIQTWEQAHSEGLARARSTLDEIAAQETADLAVLSVALRVLRTLVAQARD